MHIPDVIANGWLGISVKANIFPPLNSGIYVEDRYEALVGRVPVILDSLLYTGTYVRCQVAPTTIVSSLSRIHYSSPTSYVSDAQCVAISQISGYNHAVKQAVLK